MALLIAGRPAFIEDDHVIEALTADQADHAFHVGSLPRRPRRRKHFLDAHVLDLLRKVVTKDSVPVPQQIAWCRVPRERVAELLGCPLRCRVGRDIEVEYPAPIVSEHQEHVENLKPDGRHGEEIDGYQALHVIVQERPPGLRRRLAVAQYVLVDAGLADVNAQFEPFAGNAGSTPERILATHLADQIADLFWNCWPSDVAVSDLSCPEKAKAFAMPGDDRFRLDDHQSRSPVAPDAA